MEQRTGLRLHRSHTTTPKQLCCRGMKHVHAPMTQASMMLQVVRVGTSRGGSTGNAHLRMHHLVVSPGC